MPDAETQTQCVSAVVPPPPRWVAWRPPRLGFGAPHPPDPLHHHQHHHTGPLQEHGMAFNDAVRRLSHVLAQEHAAKAGGAPLEDTYFAATATDIVHAQCSAAAAETGDSVQPDDTPVVGDRAWRKLCAHHPRLIPPPPQLQIVDYGRLTTEASEAPSTSVVGSDAPLPDDAGVVDRVTQWLHDALRWFERFLAGGIAGALAKSVIAPGDRVKILFQVDPSREFSLARAVRVAVLIVEHAGVQGLWTGHCATLMRVVPQAATNFMAFETFHPRIERWLNGPAPASDPDHVLLKKSQGLFRKALPSFLAGAMAGATATTCTYPLDLIRARYAAHWDTTKRYPSYSVALREVVQLEGFTGLYAGLRPTLSGIIPYAGVSFGSFATLKATVRKAQGLEDEAPLPTYQQVVVGASAGLVAQSATYPLDIVRRRMQVHPARYPTMGSVFTDILRNEGPKALYKGLSMNWIKGPIAHGIAFTANDKLKARIHHYHVEVATADAAPDPDALPVWAKLMCGGMAGGLAKLWTLPFDRVKIMWAIGRHTGGGGPEEQLHTAREMLTDSSRRMYQGAGAMMMRTVPYAAVTYATFDSYQRLFERLVFAEEPSIFTDACAGAAAASTATVLFHPFDLLRAQSATHDQPFYTTARGGLRRLCREGGGIRALGHGLMPAVVGIAPLSAAGFAMYHGLTDRYMGPDPHFTDRLFYGDVSIVMAISSSSPAAAADELRLLSLMLKRFAPAMTEHQARGIATRIDAVVCHLGGRAPCPRDATAHDASAFVESLEPVSFLPPTPPTPARDAGASRTLPSLPSAEARPDTKPDPRPDRSTTQSKPEPLKTEPLLSSLGAAALSDIATVEGTTRPSAPESPAHSVVTPRVVLSQSARRSLQRQSLRDSTIHSAAHSAAHSSISLPRQDTFVTEGPNSARAPRPPAGRGNANGIFGGATPAMTPTSPSVLKAPHPPLPQGSGVGVTAASVSVQSVLPRSAVPGTGAAQRALVSTQLPDARDVEAIVGAAAFEMLEATLLAIGATSGALYLKVQSELVSVATIVPGRTYPAPIVRFTAAGSLANSVLSTGLALSQHLPGADDANVRHKNMLLFPVVTRDQRRVAVIQAADKYSGAAPFTPVDESILVNAACLFAELLTRGGKLVSWTGPAFDPVALHKASPFQPPLHPPEAVRALPPDIRDFRTPTLVLRTADAAAAVQRNKGRDDAVALSPLAPVMAVDCYVANLQTCWHRAVQRNMQHETRDAQRAKDLRVLQEDLDDAKKHAGTLEERLRLEGLGASDYQREYAALRAELGAYLDRRKMYE